jgi:hypothetical protein
MEPEVVTLSSLPNWVLAAILDRLPMSWRALARFVCRKWRGAIGKPRSLPVARVLFMGVEAAFRREYDSTRGKDLCTIAAGDGLLEVLQWARATGCPWGPDTCAKAAKHGHLAILQWARSNGCPWDELTCSCAANGGHLEVLQWAHANGCPWDKDVCEFAARGGHLAVLQWAHANGAHWSKAVCAYAAYGGHLTVLQWAHENGYLWYRQWVINTATARGYPDMVSWAKSAESFE